MIIVNFRFTFPGEPMNNNNLAGALKILSYVVIAAMAAALLYAAYITLANWPAIAV